MCPGGAVRHGGVTHPGGGRGRHRGTRGGREGAGAWPGAAPGRPPLALALLVPAASVSVLLAVRERLEAQREALRRSALTDPLTGLANRRSLLARIDYEVSRHTRARRPFGVMMLDLDGFKALNDRFGHPAGDDLLRDVSAAIARAIRDQDTAARMGGDEFCVLAPETDLAGTQQLCERVLAAVATVTAGIEALGASAGIALFPGDGTQAMFLLEAADQQLLQSKRRRGRGHAPPRRIAASAGSSAAAGRRKPKPQLVAAPAWATAPRASTPTRGAREAVPRSRSPRRTAACPR